MSHAAYILAIEKMSLTRLPRPALSWLLTSCQKRFWLPASCQEASQPSAQSWLPANC